MATIAATMILPTRMPAFPERRPRKIATAAIDRATSAHPGPEREAEPELEADVLLGQFLRGRLGPLVGRLVAEEVGARGEHDPAESEAGAGAYDSTDVARLGGPGERH